MVLSSGPSFTRCLGCARGGRWEKCGRKQTFTSYHEVEIDYEKQLDENVYLALGSGAEFFVSPYDATHEDSEVDIDLLYRFDLTKLFKLRLKTHQEPIPRVPLCESPAVDNGLWTYLGESEVDPLAQIHPRGPVPEASFNTWRKRHHS